MKASVVAVLAATAVLALPAGAAPTRDLIVFGRTVDSRQELFSIRSDGSGLRRLTHDRRHESEPAISPDGRLIAAAGGTGIVLRTRAGRLVRRIPLRSQVTELSWSPGGRWLAYLAERCQSEGRGDNSPLCADLWLIRPDGRFRRRLVEANVYTNNLRAGYSWGPGGQSIVFERYERRGLAIVDVGTGSIRTLPGTVRFGSSDPAWSRSGWIAFARQRGPFRGSDLYLVRPNGRALRKACRAENAEQPLFSKDGRQLTFLDSRPTGGANRWFVRVRTELGRCRTIGIASEEWTLAWSPDGTRLLWELFGERLVVGRADGRGTPRVLTRGTLADWG